MKNKHRHKLSKSNYIQYLDCQEELWLEKNQPDALPPVGPDRQYKLDQGNLIDQIAQEWFLDGCDLEGQTIDPSHVSFQLKEEYNGFLAIADIVVHQPGTSVISLFEVKAATEVKKEHSHDLAFQRMVFEGAGYQVAATFLVHVDRTYRTSGRIDHCALMKIKDISGKVSELMEETRQKAQEALQWIHSPEPEKNIPVGCSKKGNCPFLKLHFPDFPPYSVFNISRISQKKLKALIEKDIWNLDQVPESFPLSDLQRRQVALFQNNETKVEKGNIREFLNELVYPLYFLDYESYSYVIPPQENYSPYQQMVFQYSLHVRDEPNSPLRHYEYILKRKEEPVVNLLEDMQAKIGAKGSVIVWNQHFEKTRNKEMAECYPDLAGFLGDMNERMVDLMIPFQKGYYQHPGFKGRASLKSVLPVLSPESSYSDLEIQNGMAATLKWHEATNQNISVEDRKHIYAALSGYCHLDTLAMVRILASLSNIQ